MKMVHVMKKFTRIALATTTIASIASPATAQSQQRFDLICAVRSKADSPQHELRYSVDLDRSQWCGPRCQAPEAIASVAPDQLILKNMGPIGNDPLDRNDRHTIKVRRADGAYESVFAMRAAGLFEIYRGTCRVAEFTVFPKTLF